MLENRAALSLRRLLVPLVLFGAIATGVTSGLVRSSAYVGATAICLVVATVLFFKPVAACAVLIISTVLTSGAPRGWPVPLLRVNELILGALLAILLVRWALLTVQSRETPRLGATDLAFGVWFLSASAIPFIVMVLRRQPVVVDSALVLLAPLQYYALYRILIGTLTTEDDAAACLRVWLVSGAFVSVIGLLQALRFPAVVEALANIFPTKHTELIAGGLLRSTSVFGNWHAWAAFLVFQVVAVTSILMHPTDTALGKRAWPSVGLLALCLLAFVTAVSAAGIVGLLLSVLLLAWLGQSAAGGSSAKLLFCLIVMLALGVWVFQPLVAARLDYQFGGTHSLVPSTFQERIRIWRSVLAPEIGQHMLFGSGPLIPPSLGIRTEESYYGFLLLRGGLVALGGFVASAGLLVLHVYKTLPDSEGFLKLLSGTTLVVLLVTLVMNVSNAYWGYSGVAEAIWMLLALTDAVLRSKKDTLIMPDPPDSRLGRQRNRGI